MDARPSRWKTFLVKTAHFYEWEKWEDRDKIYAMREGLPREAARALNLKFGDALYTSSFDVVAAAAKKIVVSPSPPMTYRFQVLAAKQQKGERFWHFYLRLRALVDDADYTVPCRHAKEGNQKCSADCPGVVDYGDAVLRDVLIAGIYDAEIKRMVFLLPDVHKMDLKELVEWMEFREALEKL